MDEISLKYPINQWLISEINRAVRNDLFRQLLQFHFQLQAVGVAAPA